MKKHFLIFSAAGLLLASCKPSQPLRSRTVKSIDVENRGVIQRPLAVDLDVQKEKVTATATGRKSLGQTYIRNTAMANAIREADADVLVEPVFEVNETEKQITVTVTAYAGVYKNFRNTVAADSSWMRYGTYLNTAKTPESAPVLIKKKGGAVLLLGLLGLAAVGALAALLGAF